MKQGTELGHYRIVRALGKGGMGEVYLAIDMKLKREVAVKVLPSELAADPERLARFQREAEVLASLNRPNIAAIYGLEEPRRESDDRKRSGHPSSQRGTLTGIGACARSRHNSGGAYA